MTRRLKQRESILMARSKRTIALARHELNGPSDKRQPSAGVTSLAVKAEDPETRKMIDDFLAAREWLDRSDAEKQAEYRKSRRGR